MASVILPYGNSSVPGELTSLQNSRYRVTTKTPIQTSDNIPAKNLALGTAFSTVYTVDSDEAAFANLYLVSSVIGSDVVNRAQAITVTQTWETLTNTFVQEIDDVTETTENGLKRVTRTLIALTGTSHADYVVGTSTFGGDTLAQKIVEENDAYVRLKLVYGAAGTLSTTTTTANNGALSTIVIESANEVPATPSGYTLVSTQVINEEGFETTRYTFVKGTNQIISQTDETRNNGALLLRSIRYIAAAGTVANPIPAQSGYTLISIGVEQADGYTIWSAQYAQGSGEISRQTDTGNNGALLRLSVRYLTAPGASEPTPSSISGYTKISVSKQEEDGYILWSLGYAQGNGQISQEDGTQNNGKLLTRSIRYLTAPGAGNPISTPSGYTLVSEAYQEADGHRIWSASFAKGEGRVSESTDTRNNGKLVILTIRYFNTDSGTAPTGVLVSESAEQADGYVVYTKSYATGSGRVSESTETRNNGKLVLRSIRYLGTDDGATPAGVLISESSDQSDGYVSYSKTYAEGDGRVSLSTETRNNGKLTISTIQYLGVDDGVTPSGVLISERSEESNGYVSYTEQYAYGEGRISLSTDTRNNGKLVIRTVRYLGTDDGTLPAGVLVSEQSEQSDGYVVYAKSYADGEGRISLSTDTRNNGKLTISTIQYLGSDDGVTPSGVLISERSEESNGYVSYTEQYAYGEGRISLSTDTRNNGKLVIRTVRYLGTDDGTLPAGVLVSEQSEQSDGYVVYAKSYADGEGRISLSTDTRNNGKLTISTIQYLGSDDGVTPSGVLISERSEESNGYVSYTEQYADGEGRISLSTDTRNNGKLVIRTVRYLGTDDGTLPTGVLVSEQSEQSDGYVVYTKSYADGDGRISLSTDTRNNGKLTISTVRYLGTDDGVAPTGVLISESSEQSDGYVVYNKQYADGSGRISESTETRNNGALTITTIRYIDTDDGGAVSGALISTQTDKADGYDVTTETYADGAGIITVSESAGPVPGTTTVRTVQITAPGDPEPTVSGVLMEREEQQANGHVIWTHTAVTGTITGTKLTYSSPYPVRVPGTVDLTTVSVTAGALTGTIAVANVTPPREKTVAATVTLEVTTTPPSTSSLAYDLGAISCSVTSTGASYNYGGYDEGRTDSGSVRMSYPRRSANISANIQTFPNCYLSGLTTVTGSFTYNAGAQYSLSSGGTVLTETVRTSTETNTLTGTGATSATGYTTTGILERKSRPAFTALDGTIYYEVLTWSV